MYVDRYIQNSAKIKCENTLLKFLFSLLVIAVIFNSYFVYKAVKYERIVLVPACIDKRVTISGNRVSPEYIKLFTRYILNLALDYTPSTAKGQFSELLTFCTPDFYPVFKQTLSDLSDRIKELSICSLYYPQDITINFLTHTIKVTGIERQWSEGQKIEDSKKTYILSFRIRDGRFWLDGFKEGDNNE